VGKRDKRQPQQTLLLKWGLQEAALSLPPWDRRGPAEVLSQQGKPAVRFLEILQASY
jgi:hypothetical protein